MLRWMKSLSFVWNVSSNTKWCVAFSMGKGKKTRSFKNGQKVTVKKGRPSLLDNIKSLGNENFSSSHIAS